MSKDKGCPIPPAPPRTATFDAYHGSSQLLDNIEPVEALMRPQWLQWSELHTCRALAEKLLCWQAPKSCLDIVRAASMMMSTGIGSKEEEVDWGGSREDAIGIGGSMDQRSCWSSKIFSGTLRLQHNKTE